MHGIMLPASEQSERRRANPWTETFAWLRRRRMFMLIVVLPTLLVGSYFYLVASDQYESEAHFLVRSTHTAEAPAGIGMSQALSMVTGASSSQSEAMSVADYLTSHDAVATLRRDNDLVGRYHDRDADVFSRLRPSNPTPEYLLRYFQGVVKVNYNSETGITTLRVHSFRPQDSFAIARRLLELGELRVNMLNERSYHDAIDMSRRQLAKAETDLAAVQAQTTRFRQTRGDIDPKASGEAQIQLVSTLTGQLAAARAQLNAMGGMVNHGSPQYQALASRVSALQAQVAAQSGRLTNGNHAIATDISGYESLKLREQFLAKQYESAATALDRARETALRQQLYVVRIVDANLPVKALYPERGRIMLTMVLALLLTYSIGWLIVAGVREHAA
ncbi:lipopolysaccharide biosynthesis protein [Sphingomonas nostoxanthinifaciens]|nr:lipopolysaccharide biosynthesis protein [Sphingomonas nostoxanthinifaciens]